MSQTSITLLTDKTNAIQHKVLWIAWSFLGTTAIFAVLSFMLSLFVFNAWQLYAVAAIFTVFGVITLVSMAVTRQRRPGLGVWLLVASMWIVFPVASLLIAGFGVLLGIGLPLVTLLVVTQTLPQRQSNRAIFGSLVIGIITFLLDRVALDYQLIVPGFQTFIVGLTIIVLVIFTLLIIRQFADYSLRVKLIIMFLFLSLLSATVVTYFANRTASNTLTDKVGTNLSALANSQSLAIGDLLARQVDVLLSLSLSRGVHDRLLLANTSYGTAPDEIQDELQEIDQAWVAATDDLDFAIRPRLRNSAATELNKFRDSFPDHLEVFITDQHGGVMAATNRTSDFYQADEAWWQSAYNNGRGAIYISQPTYDESSDAVGLIIAVPFFDDDNQTVIGILRSTYNLATLKNLLNLGEEETSLQAHLLFPHGKLLSADKDEFKTLPPAMLSQLQASLGNAYGEFLFEDEPGLVSQMPVVAITGEPVIENLGWVAIVHQARQDALVSVQTQTQNIILTGLLIAGASIIVAVVVARQLTNPIVRLTSVAQQVTAGDLASQALVESKDEVGTLAVAFNTMAAQLGKTVDTLEEQVAERTQQLETVVEVGQQLSGILDLNDLMHGVVTLTKETFNYYHVHIYLLEEDTLVMSKGYGRAGAEMKQRGHSISLAAPKSLVARAARESKIITVEDVRDDKDWLPNALLPDTHSEMAVPVMLGLEVVGVLDVQSEKVGGLTQEDETALRALANQIAIAVRNARFVAKTQQTLDEVHKLQNLYTGQTWEQFGISHATTNYEVSQPGLAPLKDEITPEVMAALQQKQTVEMRSGSYGNGPVEKQADGDRQKLNAATALATPLKLRDEIIGVLGINDENPDRHWTKDEIALIEAVSEQMSLAIENARLFEETGRRAGREKVIADVTQQVWASDQLEMVMQTAVEQLGSKLNASKVIIRLGTKDELLSI